MLRIMSLMRGAPRRKPEIRQAQYSVFINAVGPGVFPLWHFEFSGTLNIARRLRQGARL